MVIIIGLAFWLGYTRLRVGYLLSPLSVMILLLVAIFGVRPLRMMQTATFDFYGYDISSGVQFATTVGLVATVGVVMGALVCLPLVGRLVRDNTGVERAETGLGSAVGESFVAAIAILAVWFALSLQFAGGIAAFVAMFGGRTSQISSSAAGVPVVVPALPVVAALVVAAVRFTVEGAARYMPRQNLMYWVVIALTIIPPTALGNRRFLIPALIVGVAGAARILWFRRVRVRYLVAVVLVFVILASIPFVRSAGSRVRGSDDFLGSLYEYVGESGLTGVFDAFFLSYDTEMFNYVSFFGPRLGDAIPYGHGQATLGELFLVMLPSGIAPGEKWSDMLLTEAFGAGCGALYCPVPSVFGTLLVDGGLVFVFLGSFLLGLLAAPVPYQLAVAPPAARVLLLLAVVAFAATVVRGNPVSQLWIALQCTLLAILVFVLLIRRASRRSSRRIIAEPRRA
ncbi:MULTISPECIES: hypothetical protein [unclassified Microbacterium]|uniref:hypothetical protein n=1 Tax=unclassified Microbacterium TaxID=2609290 RepID=UPI00214C84B2|nr:MULTISPECIES: hypothetical protein [unclassified Microbacterium]MCR2784961.1 hypothetical protein [Microbacterium sp. zg.B96]WIM16500.1 hypothetical protein QNO11_02350 [Microbacterium sp. zg-B96]